MSDEGRGLVCMFCGDGFGYEGSTPDEATLKAAVDHEKQCRNNPYKAEIKRLQDEIEGLKKSNAITAGAYRNSLATNTEDVYVVVTERDTYNPQEDSRPIVFEQYVDIATLENTRIFQSRLGDRYGKTQIAKLQFIE